MRIHQTELLQVETIAGSYQQWEKPGINTGSECPQNVLGPVLALTDLHILGHLPSPHDLLLRDLGNTMG